MSQPNQHCDCSISDDSGIIQTCISCSISQTFTHTQYDMIQDIITSNIESQDVYLSNSFINLNDSFSNIPSQPSQPPSQNAIQNPHQASNLTSTNKGASKFWQPWGSQYVSSEFETDQPQPSRVTPSTAVKRPSVIVQNLQKIPPHKLSPEKEKNPQAGASRITPTTAVK